MYLSRPLLLDGFKFDIRMYALITSCSPLRMYKVRPPHQHEQVQVMTTHRNPAMDCFCPMASFPPLLCVRLQFNDGLVRLCTEEYVRPGSGNLDERCMHLTNYAINKFSEVRNRHHFLQTGPPNVYGEA